jgi:hypothetical protein
LLFLGLMGHYVGIIVGEEKIYSFSLKIYFSWIKGVEAAVDVAVFFASFEQTANRMNFEV